MAKRKPSLSDALERLQKIDVPSDTLAKNFLTSPELAKQNAQKYFSEWEKSGAAELFKDNTQRQAFFEDQINQVLVVNFELLQLACTHLVEALKALPQGTAEPEMMSSIVTNVSRLMLSMQKLLPAKLPETEEEAEKAIEATRLRLREMGIDDEPVGHA